MQYRIEITNHLVICSVIGSLIHDVLIHFSLFFWKYLKSQSIIHPVSISSGVLQIQANISTTKRCWFVPLQFCQNSKMCDITDFCPVHRNPCCPADSLSSAASTLKKKKKVELNLFWVDTDSDSFTAGGSGVDYFTLEKRDYISFISTIGA